MNTRSPNSDTMDISIESTNDIPIDTLLFAVDIEKTPDANVKIPEESSTTMAKKYEEKGENDKSLLIYITLIQWYIQL